MFATPDLFVLRVYSCLLPTYLWNLGCGAQKDLGTADPSSTPSFLTLMDLLCKLKKSLLHQTWLCHLHDGGMVRISIKSEGGLWTVIKERGGE